MDSRANPGRFAVAAIGLVAGGALMAMAGPIVAGAAAALPGDQAATALRHRVSITDDDVVGVIDSRIQALGRFGAVEWRRELATASLVPRGGKPAPANAVARGTEQTRKALSLAPTAAQDWLRLGLIELRGGNQIAASRYLSTGLVTGADMARTRVMIVELGFALWPDLPVETKARVLDALRHEWQGRGDRARLIAQARAAGLMPLVTLALSGEPDFDLRRLDRLKPAS